ETFRRSPIAPSAQQRQTQPRTPASAGSMSGVTAGPLQGTGFFQPLFLPFHPAFGVLVPTKGLYEVEDNAAALLFSNLGREA
ncbi:hypothetical protein, partial [Actibacterium sp. MT2.3-13A]|uniref:hypothetical protein n=1 Tax=Actibacterium sp. MT2.3-13A TaxID=2828332 RepID=UPI001BA7FDA1